MELETDYAWVYHNFIENGYHIPFNIQIGQVYGLIWLLSKS